MGRGVGFMGLGLGGFRLRGGVYSSTLGLSAVQLHDAVVDFVLVVAVVGVVG